MQKLYNEEILKHAKTPQFTSKVKKVAATGHAVNQFCGDEVDLQITLDGNKVGRVGVQSQGCSINKASASMLSEAVFGKSVDEIVRLTLDFEDMMRGHDVSKSRFESFGDLKVLVSVRDFPIRIKLIISNNPNAKGLRFAKQYSIPYKFFSSDNKEKFERNSLFEIKKRKIKFLCLAGFMKILSNNFIKAFGYKIVNIHPSLLPKYKGLNTHKRVLKSKEKYSGCTVHLVTPQLDSGKIILQKKTLLDKNETEKSLKTKILRQEHKLYPQSIISVFR